MTSDVDDGSDGDDEHEEEKETDEEERDLECISILDRRELLIPMKERKRTLATSKLNGNINDSLLAHPLFRW